MNNQSPIYCENGLQYTLNENCAFIYRYEGDDEKLVIPCRLLQSDKREVFRIPDNIRRIQRGAFNGCGFREVFFPDKMKLVPDAFENCTNLETIHFPASLRAIDTLAFSGSGCIRYK